MGRATGVLSPDGRGAERSADRQSDRQHADAGFRRGDPAVRLPLQALTRDGGLWVGRFRAMGGPCEVLAEIAEESAAREIVNAVAACAWRIEDKFSRERADSIIGRIKAYSGAPVEVDDDTGNLVDFAEFMHR